MIVQSTKKILQTTTFDCATSIGHGIVDATGTLDQRLPCPYCICQLGSSGKWVHLPFNPVEQHRSLGGRIISRLDNGAFVGLIYGLLFFS